MNEKTGIALHSNKSLGKTPLYTCERIRVNKANNILVLLWKLFWPWKHLRDFGVPIPHCEILTIKMPCCLAWMLSCISKVWGGSECGTLRVSTLFLTLTHMPFSNEQEISRWSRKTDLRTFCFSSMAAPVAYGHSPARDWIQASAVTYPALDP